MSKIGDLQRQVRNIQLQLDQLKIAEREQQGIDVSKLQIGDKIVCTDENAIFSTTLGSVYTVGGYFNKQPLIAKDNGQLCYLGEQHNGCFVMFDAETVEEVLLEIDDTIKVGDIVRFISCASLYRDSSADVDYKVDVRTDGKFCYIDDVGDARWVNIGGFKAADMRKVVSANTPGGTDDR